MADDAHTEALSEETQPAEDAQPDDLTVQSDADQPELPDPSAETASVILDAVAQPEAEPAQESADGDEPESRLMLETTQDAVHKALSRLRIRLHECVQRRLARLGEG